MITRKQVTLTLPKDLIMKADSRRGLVPRSRYFELAISEFLDKKGDPAPVKRKTKQLEVDAD